MRRVILSAAAAVVLLGGATPAPAADKAAQNFLTEAMQGNLAEQQVGKLAQDKGQSEGVKSYGQMLANDHGDANNRAREVANKIGVTPPTGPNKEQAAVYDKLSKLSGPAFDREFAKEMVEDHQKDIQKYQRAARDKNDPVGEYASQTLPTLEKHLQEAKSLTQGKSTSH
jgi:putative membrane protein